MGNRASSNEVPTPVPADGRTWTFLTNHGHVLVCLNRNPGARVRDIAAEVGITERAAHGILAELEADGYVTRFKRGRRNEYVIHPQETFRHPAESSRTVGELLKIFDTPHPES